MPQGNVSDQGFQYCSLLLNCHSLTIPICPFRSWLIPYNLFLTDSCLHIIQSAEAAVVEAIVEGYRAS